LLIVLAMPVFYFVSPYTWLQTEPRYLTLVVPVFALLIAWWLTTPWRTAVGLAAALALTVAGLAELDRHDVVAFRTEGVAVPQDLQPVLRTLRDERVGYAFASYWVAWRITFESGLDIVGAKSSYLQPLGRRGRVYPGDHLNDLGFDPTYYRRAIRHRDAAHVFVLGGNVEPRVAPLLRRNGYRRVVRGGFSVWLPPRA